MRDVVMMQLSLTDDPLPLDYHAICAVTVGDECLPVLAFDHRMEAAHAVVGQYQVISRTSPDADEWLRQFEHAALAVRRRDDDATHENY